MSRIRTLFWDCAALWSICLFATAHHWYTWIPLGFVAVYFFGKRLDVEYQAGVRGDREKKCHGNSCSCDDSTSPIDKSDDHTVV